MMMSIPSKPTLIEVTAQKEFTYILCDLCHIIGLQWEKFTCMSKLVEIASLQDEIIVLETGSGSRRKNVISLEQWELVP